MLLNTYLLQYQLTVAVRDERNSRLFIIDSDNPERCDNDTVLVSGLETTFHFNSIYLHPSFAHVLFN